MGPHQSYGFAPGTVFGKKAELKILPEGLSISNPSLEHIVTVTENKDTILMLLLNQHHETQAGTIKIDFQTFGRAGSPKAVRVLDQNGEATHHLSEENGWRITVPAYGLAILELVFEG